jgi:aldehyde:ferredoxin oxidoreductase
MDEKIVFPYKCFTGQYLRVDLTKGSAAAQELPLAWAEGYLGGNGIGTRILWEEVPPEVDPLSAENRLIMAPGLLGGTLMPNCGRLEVIAKSPLTGIYGDANAGGFLAPEIKYAGYDLIVVQGRADKPVYLLVEGGRAELREAAHLWGQTTSATERAIQKEVGDPDVKVACIGPAGENRVRYACIMVSYARSAARAGMGAVMGAKNLKAVAVRGFGGLQVAEPERFYRVAVAVHQAIRRNEFYPGVSRYGTPGLVVLMNQMGRFPTKNFQLGSFPWAEEICAEVLREHYFVKDIACFNCPVACDKVYRVREGQFANTTISSVEYETLGSLGAGVWNRDLEAILYANQLCDDLGMDTISAGRTIAFALECAQRGLLSPAEADGLDLTWGNVTTLLALLEKIARRQGIGDLLAEGTRRAAHCIGQGAAEYAMQIKGQEIAAQDGRAQQSMGLAHVTSSRGADHLKGFPTIDETGYPSEAVRRYGQEYLPELIDPLATRHKAMLVKDGEDFGAIVDSCGNCKSGGTFVMAEVYWPEMAEAVEAATGMPMSVERLQATGERIYNLQRCYNVLHGITRQDDTQPRRLLTEPSPSGHAKGHVLHLEAMLEEYYRLRGWEPATGIPTARKLRDLGLAEAVERLSIEP